MIKAGTNYLRIGKAADWHFVNGEWADGDGNVLKVPEETRRSEGYGIQAAHYAFHRKFCFRDVSVRFQVRLTGHSDAGIIFRATDESHFYLLHFPNCGQASRAQHFWAAFSRMDSSGYLKLIKMDLVRRVPSNSGLWLNAEVTLSGEKLTVKIGEHGYFESEDRAYSETGYVGLYSWGAAGLRNLVVEGKDPGPAVAVWNDTVRQPTNWFHPCPDVKNGQWQKPVDLVRCAGGRLLLFYTVQENSGGGEITPFLSRSSDQGRTWSKPEVLEILKGETEWETGRLHVTPKGRLICFFRRADTFFTADSADEGRTWSVPVSVEIGPKPARIEKLSLGPQAFLNLKDGSMVLFCYGGYDLKNADLTIYTWGSVHCQAFACCSTDDGYTWSSPTNLDNPGVDKEGRQIEGNLDLTEVCGAEVSPGWIMALIRPVYSPWMWETWSNDRGVTWAPCVRGPFPGYAAANMLCTGSGKVLVAHRLPLLTVNCSPDGGHTWDQGTLIDGSTWVMGTMLEVEPDVVLYVYFDYSESLMRAQFLK